MIEQQTAERGQNLRFHHHHGAKDTTALSAGHSARPRPRLLVTARWILVLVSTALLLLQPCQASFTVLLEPNEVECFYVQTPDRPATLR